MRTFLTLAFATVLCLGVATVDAQSCSTLAITGTGAPGTTLNIALTGADPNTIAFVAVGLDTGTTSIKPGRLGTLTLGLATPFALAPIGMTDANGDLKLSLNTPQGNIPQQTLYIQAFTAKFSRTPTPGRNLSMCSAARWRSRYTARPTGCGPGIRCISMPVSITAIAPAEPAAAA